MELNVQIEKPSNIVRKLTIRVPANEVARHLERGLAEVQRTAKIKGFRPGFVPMNVIKQFYGDDVKHRVFHNLIDQSYQQAVQNEKLKAVGSPKIETPENKTGEGAHDHALKEDQDLTFTATVEVMPEIEVKGYTGLSLTKTEPAVTDEDVEKVVKGLLDGHAELIPVAGGLALPDGSQSSRPVQKGDYADIEFHGGVVTESGVEEKEGMKGSRVLEVGSQSLIPGFEENLEGMRKGETKTFRIDFPKDFYEASLAGQKAEFTVTVNELKEKKLPTLDEEFAKQLGYEGVGDLRNKAREYLVHERTEEADRRLRAELLTKVVEKNPFEVPAALVNAQTQALAEDWAQNLKNQGMSEDVISDALKQEFQNLRVRAESQVRASLILEAIAAKEGITVAEPELEQEISKLAKSMKVEESKLREYYAKNPSRKEDLEFRVRQERTVASLLDKAKIKAGSKEK